MGFTVIIGLIIVTLIYLFYRAYINTRQVVINYIKLDHHPAISDELHLSILHISDMHLENISVSPQHIFDQFKNERIDLIALTGDFLDRKRSIPKLIPYLEMFAKLNPEYGTYAVFGNHDYVLKQKDLDSLREVLEYHGCKTLQNSAETILIKENLINIIGIDDFSTNRSDLPASYQNIKQGYNLVLTHDPNVVLEMDDYDFNYLISGHFHGGQIHWPKPYHLIKMGQLCKMNMVKGLHNYQGKPFYISEGLGQTGVNIRIGSRPEMTIHQLNLQHPAVKREKTLTAV